jgi:hypothetical protein
VSGGSRPLRKLKAIIALLSVVLNISIGGLCESSDSSSGASRRMGGAAMPDDLHVLAGRWARASVTTKPNTIHVIQCIVPLLLCRTHSGYGAPVLWNAGSEELHGKAFYITACNRIIECPLRRLYSPNNLLTLLRTLSFSGS